MRISRASGSEWPPLSRAGGTIIKTTVDHALLHQNQQSAPGMAYLGLTPSEHSSGTAIRRGGITTARNTKCAAG
jgi:transposase